MEELRQYAVFAETATAGSMSAAAKRLGMTPSAVSQTIRALEARTGVLLLHRSTRRLTLTEAGERCLPHCLRMVEAGSGAAASLEQARDAPTGELRVAAPIGFAAHVSSALASVLADWPGLRLRLVVDDRLIDLIEARIDVALRAGNLPDSGWIGQKLCDFEGIVCASPAYLERRGTPSTPEELGGHSWLSLDLEGAPPPVGGAEAYPALLLLHLTDPNGTSERTPVPARITATSQVALQLLCEEGMGLAALFHQDVRAALDRGALVRLLPRWRLPSLPVTMVTQRRDGEPAKVRVARDAIRRYFSTL